MLAEWHLAPDYIVNNWTDELLTLMIESLSKRKERELEAIKGHKSEPKVSDGLGLARMGGMVKVVKRDGK